MQFPLRFILLLMPTPLNNFKENSSFSSSSHADNGSRSELSECDEEDKDEFSLKLLIWVGINNKINLRGNCIIRGNQIHTLSHSLANK